MSISLGASLIRPATSTFLLKEKAGLSKVRLPQFLKEYGFTENYWRVDFWQNYFHRHCTLRTVCYVCYQEIKEATFEEVEGECHLEHEENLEANRNMTGSVLLHRHSTLADSNIN